MAVVWTSGGCLGKTDPGLGLEMLLSRASSGALAQVGVLGAPATPRTQVGSGPQLPVAVLQPKGETPSFPLPSLRPPKR